MMKITKLMTLFFAGLMIFTIIGASTALAGIHEACFTYQDLSNPEQFREDCFMVDDKGNAVAGVMKGCIPLPIKLKQDQTCIFCPLFKTLYTAAQTMSIQALKVTHDPVRNVMTIGFSIYIAFMVIGHVSSLTKQDAPKFLTGLFTNVFKFLVAFLLLKYTDTIYNYVINPLLAASLDFGGSMLFEASEALKECKISGNLDGVLPMELYDRLDCFVRGVQKEIAFAQSAGSSLMCVGMNEASGKWGIWDFSMVASGLVVYLAALLLSFAFAFYLIDSVVMLGVIGAMLSFFIACWPFKLTTGYTSKGFNMFMNVFFIFIFMGIVVSINTQLIKAALESGGLGNLQKALSGNIIDEAKKSLDINAVGFLIILCCCFFGFKFSAKSAQLAGNMAGGGGMDIGAKLGGLMVSGAVNSAKRIGKGAAAPVVKKAKQMGGAAADWTKGKVSQGISYVADKTKPFSKVKMGDGTRENPQGSFRAESDDPNKPGNPQNPPTDENANPNPVTEAENAGAVTPGSGTPGSGGDEEGNPKNKNNGSQGAHNEGAGSPGQPPLMMKSTQSGGSEPYNNPVNETQAKAQPIVNNLETAKAREKYLQAREKYERATQEFAQNSTTEQALNLEQMQASLTLQNAESAAAQAVGTPNETAANEKVVAARANLAGVQKRQTAATTQRIGSQKRLVPLKTDLIAAHNTYQNMKKGMNKTEAESQAVISAGTHRAQKDMIVDLIMQAGPRPKGGKSTPNPRQPNPHDPRTAKE